MTEVDVYDDDEHDLVFTVRGRVLAVLRELEEQPPDLDVIQTLLEGAVEALEAAT